MKLLNIDYKKYKLTNGLEVILYQDKTLPLVSVNIWYKVGSGFEQKGKTGLAHFFEHMMFQGSENVAKELHFRYVQEAGGSLNGSTSFDRTNYYEKLPSNSLKLALWLESDRMGFFLDALTQEKLDNQKSVVANERLERYDNQPYGLAWEKIITTLYPENHPYSWSTIGFMEDIKNYNLSDVQNFFKKYYSPGNASIVIAGNQEIDQTKDLIEKYFGALPNYDSVVPPKTEQFHLEEIKLIEYKDSVQLDRIYLAWPTDKVFSEKDAALDILSDLLTGSKNSRLYKRLVFDEEIAHDVSAFQFSGMFGGHFMIISTAKPGINLDKLKSVIFEEVDNIIHQKIEEKELVKSKNGIRSNYIYSLQNLDTIADRLNMYNYYLNEPNMFGFDLKRYEQATELEVKKAAIEFLNNPYLELRVISNKK